MLCTIEYTETYNTYILNIWQNINDHIFERISVMRYMYVRRKLFAKFLMNSYQPISGLLIRCFFGFVVNGNAFNFDYY